MAALHFLLPGDPDSLTGGYIYDRRIINELRRLGWAVNLICLDASFPYPNEDALKQADASLAQIPDDRITLIDGLAFSAMPDIVSRHAKRLRLVALIHHPLALEIPLSATQQNFFFSSEKRALIAARRIIVTSPATARALHDYAVTPQRLAVVTPGVDPAPLAQGSGKDSFMLLCVASFTARKGHSVLIKALNSLRDYAWRLNCIGNKTLDAELACSLELQIEALSLHDRISLIDAIPQRKLSQHYCTSDLFVLASFHEGYGMVLSEALAHGLPVITTRAGAIADTVAGSGALLAEPGDSEALAHCLKDFFNDAKLRQRMHRAAQKKERNCPTGNKPGSVSLSN